MIFITYLQNSGGRSGHKLCDIFTCFVFSYLLNVKVLYNNSWRGQMILSKNSLINHTDNFNEKFDIIEKINNIQKWKCLSWEDFNTIKNKIIKIQNDNNNSNILIELSNICKIHPHIVYDWYIKNYIKEDIYHNKLLPKLRKLYYYDHNETILDCISIHIRCGDLYNNMLEYGFTFEYYKKIIDILNLHFNKQINIYCENKNYQHVYKLKEVKNVEVYIGGINEFSNHFNCLVNSKVLILSPSSLSLFAGYLSNGLVLIDNKSINFRNNLFHSSDGVIENFNNISEKIELIKTYL